MSRYIDADRIDWRLIIPTNVTIAEENMIHCAKKLVERQPTADVKEVTPCEECIHAKQHSYAPAECQYYCTISLQYHGGRFFCACGERGTDLLEWIHRGDDDEQGV